MRFCLTHLDQKSHHELLQSFIEIPDYVTELELDDNDLGNLPNQTIKEALKILATKKSIHALYLNQNNLHEKTAEELATILAAIPANIVALDLSMNQLGNYSEEELELILNAIPPHVRKLNLSENGFAKNASALIRGVAVLSHVHELSLGFSKLDEMSAEELVKLMKSLSDSIATFKLTGNHFAKKTKGEWASIMAAIKPTIISFHPGILPADVFFAFKFFPKGAREIYLDGNPLYRIPGPLLGQAFAALENVELLSLHSACFGQGRDGESATALKHLNPSVRKLLLQNNMLFKMSINALTNVIKNIPLTVNLLSFANNNLGARSNVEVTTILNALHEKVRTLDLEGNGLFQNIKLNETFSNNNNENLFNKNNEEFCKVWAAIPYNVTSLNLGNNIFEPAKIKWIAKSLKTLHKNLEIIHLHEVEFNKLSTVELKQLKNALPQVKTVYLSYHEVYQMTPENRKILWAMLPNVETVLLVDSDGMELADTPYEKTNLAREFGFKGVPTLLSRVSFFVNNLGVNLKNASIPDELKVLSRASERLKF